MYIEKIKEKIKQSGGIITSREISKSNIPTMYLTRMVERGDLIRVDRGIYIGSNGDYDEYYFFHNRCKTAIYSYLSALYLHGLTDIIPNEMEITLYRGYNSHRIDSDKVIHYVKKDIYNLGVTECLTIFGNKVKVYDLERTICDLIKNRSEIESEMFTTAINRYIRSENKNLYKLYEYSKKMNIYEKVREVIEIIL